MKYNGLTSVGSIYQAKCAANNIPVKFVKVKVGNGLLEATENPLNFTDIKSLKKEVGISEITQVNEAVRLTVPLDNDGVTEGYYPREFGIYVEDDGVEVLYWYINDGQEASYLPPQSSAPVKIKNHFNIIATSLESLIVNWDGKEFWVDKEYLEKELEVKLDRGEVTEGYNSAKKIEDEIKKRVEIENIADNLSTSTLGHVLSAKQGVVLDEQDKGILGKSNGKFPLSSATQGNVYLLEETKKYYICTTAYSGTEISVPNANFEELSVFQNRNKLENLSKIKLIFNNKQTTETGIFTLDDSIENYKFINIVYAFSSDSTGLVSVGSAVFNTDFLKSHYNSGLSFANISIAENGVNVTLECMYVKFINGTQINIEENRATNNAVLSNNKIYQIYAWN